MLFPKTSAQMNDIWHTIGLRGTASNEYIVKDLFVPKRTRCRATRRERREQGLLYRFTSNQLYSSASPASAWALPAARSMLSSNCRPPRCPAARTADAGE